VRRAVLPLLAVLVAGCGPASHTTSTMDASTPPGRGTVLYAGGDWAVVVDGVDATAYHHVAGTWRPDRSGAVKIDILGPRGTVARIPQFAVELRAHRALIESGMWVDGREIPVKGGGLNPRRGTIYGALGSPLTPGKHVAVAYARTSTHGSAIAWTFTV
jgi:hypothetical protein